MDENAWKQVNITHPGQDPNEREHHAVKHLARVLPAAEAGGLIASWWFIRKGPWRIRYQPADHTASQDADPLHPLLTAGVTWTRDIYEPEVHAFGGAASMDAAHALFHADSRHLLGFLNGTPTDRRERSLILCTALMRAAGLDVNEQGDVWAQVAEQRTGLPGQPADPQVWAVFTRDVRHLLLGQARADLIGPGWLAAFEDTGTALRTLREDGNLTRGIRAVIALHLVFHWNRWGLPATEQAMLARAAKEAVFGGTGRPRSP